MKMHFISCFIDLYIFHNTIDKKIHSIYLIDSTLEWLLFSNITFIIKYKNTWNWLINSLTFLLFCLFHSVLYKSNEFINLKQNYIQFNLVISSKYNYYRNSYILQINEYINEWNFLNSLFNFIVGINDNLLTVLDIIVY